MFGEAGIFTALLLVVAACDLALRITALAYVVAFDSAAPRVMAVMARVNTVAVDAAVRAIALAYAVAVDSGVTTVMARVCGAVVNAGRAMDNAARAMAWKYAQWVPNSLIYYL